jgi:hypothetical protein
VVLAASACAGTKWVNTWTEPAAAGRAPLKKVLVIGMSADLANRKAFEDFQMGYAFQGGSLEGLSLLLQVNNLENEPFRGSFDGRDDRPREFFEYGRTYLVGVNYKF